MFFIYLFFNKIPIPEKACDTSPMTRTLSESLLRVEGHICANFDTVKDDSVVSVDDIVIDVVVDAAVVASTFLSSSSTLRR